MTAPKPPSPMVRIYGETPIDWESYSNYRIIGEDIKHLPRYSDLEYDWAEEMERTGDYSLDISEVSSSDYPEAGEERTYYILGDDGQPLAGSEYQEPTLAEHLADEMELGAKVIRLEDGWWPISPVRSAGIYIIRGWASPRRRRPVGAYVGMTNSFSRRLAGHYHSPEEGGHDLMSSWPTAAFVRIPSNQADRPRREWLRAEGEAAIIHRHARCGVLTNTANTAPRPERPPCPGGCPFSRPAPITEAVIREWLPPALRPAPAVSG